MSKKRTRRAADAVEIMHAMLGNNPKTRRSLQRERENVAVAREVFDARTSRGLTQGQLAKLVGTTQSAIARLEDADYQGHSMSMLRRIAAALECEVEIRFVPKRGAAA